MHVVHVYDGHERVYDGRGSVPTVVWNVARETAAAGHRITVVERQWDGLPTAAEHEGVRFERLSLSTGANEPWERVPYELVASPLGLARLVADRTNFAIAALRRLRRLDADVVHVHLPFAANVVVTLAPGLRDNLVFTAHLGELRLDALESDSDEGGLDIPSVLSVASPDIYLAKRAAHTTVLNETIQRAFLDRGVPAERVSVVPNGVDVDRFDDVADDDVERVRDAYGLADVPTLLFVGTVMPRKGLDDLVRAAAALSGNETEPLADGAERFQLVIAGEDDLDGSYTAELRELVAERGLADRVTFTGFVPGEDLPALYALADVFVLPSREEGFGMTAVEAMAAGTPVVATRVGGLPTVIDDGVTGVLVDSGDVDGIAEGIRRLLESPGTRAQMGERARDRADDYRWEAVTRRVLDVYEEVV